MNISRLYSRKQLKMSPQSSEQKLKTKHICLIDDDEIAEILVSGLLKRLGALHFTYFSNGEKAQEGLSKLNEETFPDLILLDLQMPVMDGFGFLKVYAKSFYPLYPSTRLAILTSSLQSEDQVACQNFPFIEDYLIKPLMLTQLKALLEKKAQS